VAVAPCAQVLIVAPTSTSVEAHVINPEASFVSQQTRWQVSVGPLRTIRQKLCLANVEGPVIIPAVAWVSTHRLPPSAVLLAAPEGQASVVIAALPGVVHLLEAVLAGRHSILGPEFHIVPCAFQGGLPI